MAGNGNSSFIPRQTNTASRRNRSRRSISLFGYFSYIIFIGSLLAAAGMFFYAQYIQSQLAQKQSELEVVKNQFDETEMNRVREFETFLNSVSTLYRQSFVTEGLFDAIEESIASGAVINTLSIEKAGQQLLVQAEVTADSFDTALFQRGVYEEYPLLSSFTLQNVALAGGSTRQADSESGSTPVSGETVAFSLEFNIPNSEVSFVNVPLPDLTTDLGTTTGSTTEQIEKRQIEENTAEESSTSSDNSEDETNTDTGSSNEENN